MSNFSIIKGNIVKLKVDALINSANTSLLGGGGVDMAIHKTAGAELLKECETLGGCETGQAKLTKGYNLKATYIIHTPPPIWRGGTNNEVELLTNCYRNALNLAKQHQLKTLAFPSLGTGIYRFPRDLASKIAIREIQLFLEQEPDMSITMVCFDDETKQYYEKALEKFH